MPISTSSSMGWQPASHRSTSGRSARRSTSPTSPVCHLTTRSRPSGTYALPPSCGRLLKRESAAYWTRAFMSPEMWKVVWATTSVESDAERVENRALPMSHHASGPNFGFPRGDARLDMTDLYAFTKPGDPAYSIVVLNVHPSFDLNSPEPTTTEPFAPGALYEVQVDTDGDAAADLAYSVQFESSGDAGQTAIVRRR